MPGYCLQGQAQGNRAMPPIPQKNVYDGANWLFPERPTHSANRMSTRRALVFSYLDRYATLLINIASSMIIARLLTPAETGVFSLAMVIIGFIGPFRDFGASQYLIQSKEITTERIRAVWAVQLSLGVVLAILIFFLRTPIANFYHEPRISDIMLLLSLNSLIMPLGALTNAWLNREMRFDALAIIRFSSALIGTSVSTTCAWLGYGPMSLAYGSCIGAASFSLISMFYRPRFMPWMPGVAGLKSVLGFGGKMSGITLMAIAYHSAPQTILGRLQGMAPTGQFSRAEGVVSMFDRLVLDGAYTMALPLFSKKLREGEAFEDTFISAESMLTAIGWTMLGFLSLFAHPIINLLYGPQWNDSVAVVRLLSMATCLLLPAVLCGPPLIAKGRATLVFRLTTANVVLQSSLALLGAMHGIMALGYCLTASSLLISIIWLARSRRIIDFNLRRYLRSLLKSAVVVIGALTTPFAVVIAYGLEPESPLVPLSLAGAGSLIGFIAMSMLTHHPIWDEAKRFLPRKKPSH